MAQRRYVADDATDVYFTPHAMLVDAAVDLRCFFTMF